MLDKILPDITLDGEVFIVTKAGESVKLGLVPVDLIPLGDLLPYLNKKVATATNEVARLEPLVKAAQAECEIQENPALALEKELRVASPFQLERIGLPNDAQGRADARRSELNERLAVLQARKEWADEKLKSAVKWDELEKSLQFYRFGFYFDSLPPPLRTTKTNADGKFQINIPRSGSYVLAAVATRHVGESTESYYWLVKADTRGESPLKIMLSNDNLLQGLPGALLGKQ